MDFEGIKAVLLSHLQVKLEVTSAENFLAWVHEAERMFKKASPEEHQKYLNLKFEDLAGVRALIVLEEGEELE